MTSGEAMIGRHSIEWEFDDGMVIAKPVCHGDERSACRYECAAKDSYCESIGDIRVDERGKPATHGHLDPFDSAERHPMTLLENGQCNIVLFLEEEPQWSGSGRFTLAETPIVPTWEGDDYSWRRDPDADPAQTLASLRAEAVREYARTWSDDPDDRDEYEIYEDAMRFARKIERRN